MLTASTRVEPPLVTIVDESGDGYSPPAESTVSPQSSTKQSCFLSTSSHSDIAALHDGIDRDITNLHRINDVCHLNQFFNITNQKLSLGGFYIGCVEPSEQVKARILESYPLWIAWPYYTLLFIGKRIFPKLKLTRRLYFSLTKGRNRMLPKAEVLGRLVCCGFDIIDYEVIDREMFFVVQKSRSADLMLTSSYGLLFKMRRIGKGGISTYVYKLRTMHPYAEYLQSYICDKHKIKENGKLDNDFRVATWGKWARRVWLDELPMILNVIKGDLKIFGVRPLSEQYLSLYPKEIAEKRMSHKPGLIPPFYADLPKGLEEICDSEMKYMESYDRNPILTDCKYLCRVLYNILVKGARSS